MQWDQLLFAFQVRGDHKSTVVHSQYWYGDYCVDVTDSVHVCICCFCCYSGLDSPNEIQPALNQFQPCFGILLSIRRVSTIGCSVTLLHTMMALNRT